ncbi:DUF1345 domain-containing protein [Micromonospora sp. DT81.3]|uniref:DUF1345 domain-containing protein n=1 Tax=Micromonospora sp. DT81.3 TaxID=3416523 RepID=UPI003CE6F6BC
MNDRVLSTRRALICVGAGALAGAIAALAASPALAPLAGWCTAGIIALVWVWRMLWRLDSPGTQRVAREESDSHVTDNAIVAACIASIVAVVLALIESRQQSGNALSVALVILGVAGTMVAWALVNTVYALKYARMYYVDQGRDGFDTKEEADPTYSDFAYFAFTIGMSYAAPEVEPVNSEIRRKALFHALLSFFFGTVLIAVSINLVTNLGQG